MTSGVRESFGTNPEEFTYRCTECGVEWRRNLCGACLGTEYDGLEPCGCDGGFMSIGTITFVLPEEKIEGRLLFGSKVNRSKDSNGETGAF